MKVLKSYSGTALYFPKYDDPNCLADSMDAFMRHSENGARSLSTPQLHSTPCSDHPLQNKPLAGSNHPGQLPWCSQVRGGATSATNHINCLQPLQTRTRYQRSGKWITGRLGKTETVFILPGNNQQGLWPTLGDKTCYKTLLFAGTH